MAQGRIKENDTILDKWVLTSYEVPNKPEIGSKTIWYFDINKTDKGCYKVEHIPAKGEKLPKVQVNKTQTYGGVQVGMVFKTSKNANAKTKLKVWNNTNIDYIITQDKLPGVPDKAVILELGVGEELIKTWMKKYGIK